jgi:hypothetical protein
LLARGRHRVNGALAWQRSAGFANFGGPSSTLPTFVAAWNMLPIRAEEDMTIAQDFVTHAGDEDWIKNFFATHIVMTSYGSARNTKGIHMMGVVDGWTTGGMNLNYAGRTSTGGVLPVVTVANESTMVDTFASYWCPYAKNNAPHVHLKSGASWMFTAKMDGCSFGIGIPSGTGSVYVAHANQGGKGDEQLTMLQGHTKFAGGLSGNSYGPANYRYIVSGTASTMATTFGIRVGTTWKFYSQVTLVDRGAKTLTWTGLLPVG